ncbi:MAG: DeoR/GlpR family DNA-binding transcription regulator [Oscillospiraceae bacterium]|nr:DeoR/GlpR family DNA-binding transcription regulator [Oscillospiraceae bacterium]
MFAYERRNKIKQLLTNDKTVTVENLSKQFFVSESTIRRDLDKLADDGAIRRTYGGAFMLENLTNDLPITIREHENIDAKNIIAQKAVKYIQDGATIIMDTSSTVTALVPLLNVFEGLTVITNGIKTTYLLNSYGKITTYCTGGRLREHNMSLVGTTTCQRLGEINADIAFISCRGLSVEKGVTESSEEEAQVKKAMINAASKTILLCDASKLDMVLMNRVCEIKSLHAIICDVQMPEKFNRFCVDNGVRYV